MSRSIHKTLKSVFGGQSKAALKELTTTNDSDVMELVEKARFKNAERRSRAARNAARQAHHRVLQMLPAPVETKRMQHDVRE